MGSLDLKTRALGHLLVRRRAAGEEQQSGAAERHEQQNVGLGRVLDLRLVGVAAAAAADLEALGDGGEAAAASADLEALGDGGEAAVLEVAAHVALTRGGADLKLRCDGAGRRAAREEVVGIQLKRRERTRVTPTPRGR